MDTARPSQKPQVTPSQASRPSHLGSGNNIQVLSYPKLGSRISELGSGKVAGKVLIVDQYSGPAKILILLETVLKWCPGEIADTSYRHFNAQLHKHFCQFTYQCLIVNRHVLCVSLCGSQKSSGNGISLVCVLPL